MGEKRGGRAAGAICPVWICRRPVGEGLKEILVPLDFSEGNRAAVERADALAIGFEAVPALMHVVTMPSFSVFFWVFVWG